MNDKKPKILFYDIETSPLKAYIWRLGDQVVRHDQLTSDGFMYNIICITYCWNDGLPAQSLDWGYEAQNSKQMVKDFDDLIRQADLVVGKNNISFDNRHINTQRLIHDGEAMPDWGKKSDDLQTQMKKYFGKALPSQSLDYISKLLGVGGKLKMGLDDWIDIVEKRNPASLIKMIEYGKKDVEDTRAIWERVEKHISPKFRHTVKNTVDTLQHSPCTECQSVKFQKRGTRVSKVGKWHRYQCQGCGTWTSIPCETNGGIVNV